MRPSRSGFDYECGTLRSNLILNEFRQIRLIGCLKYELWRNYFFVYLNRPVTYMIPW